MIFTRKEHKVTLQQNVQKVTEKVFNTFKSAVRRKMIFDVMLPSRNLTCSYVFGQIWSNRVKLYQINTSPYLDIISEPTLAGLQWELLFPQDKHKKFKTKRQIYFKAMLCKSLVPGLLFLQVDLQEHPHESQVLYFFHNLHNI